MNVVKTKKSETLLTNVEEQDKQTSSETISREEVKDSPFHVITIDGESFGIMGDYRLTEKMSKEKVKKELKKITWNRIIQVIMLLDEIKTNLKTSK
jgi:translation elongation factor P/translation initiation factor 5A